MKLFTKEIDKLLFHQYQFGNDLEKQVVVAKIFNPYGKGVWYLLNSDPDDPEYLWAIVDLFEIETGSVNRSDLESMKVPPFRLPLERDRYFTPKPATEILQGLLSGKRYADGGIMASGGLIKTYHKSEAYRLTPYNSIPKEILDKVRSQIENLKLAGNFYVKEWKNDGYLYFLDEYDRNLVADYELKPQERIYRYLTYTTASGGMIPLIKVNQENGLVYSPIWSNEDEFLGFDKKGQKTVYLNLVEVDEEDYYKHGGQIDDENAEMLKNQAYTISHHSKELSDVSKKVKNAEPWVITKAQRASTDLADITHYLEGEDSKMASGGELTKIQENEDVLINDMIGNPLKIGDKVAYDKWYKNKYYDGFEGYIVEFLKETSKQQNQSYTLYGKPKQNYRAKVKVVKRTNDVGKLSTYEMKKKSEFSVARVDNLRKISENGEPISPYDSKNRMASGGSLDYANVSKNELEKILIGRYLEIYNLGVKEPSLPNKIISVEIDEPKYRYRYVRISVDKNYAPYAIPLENLKDFLGGDSVEVMGEKEPYLIKLVGKSKMASGGMMAHGGNIGVNKFDKNFDEVENDAITLSKSYPVIYMVKRKDGEYVLCTRIDEVNEETKTGSTISGIYSEGKKVLEYGGMMAKGGKLDLDAFKKKYDRNEEANAHSENVLLLAKQFGSEQDVRDARTILAKHDAIGYLPENLYQEREALRKKLWKKYMDAKGDGSKMADGGEIKFSDKVAAIKRGLLERKKVSPKVQKDYGKTYSPKEAEESAKRIAGAMRKKEMSK